MKVTYTEAGTPVIERTVAEYEAHLERQMQREVGMSVVEFTRAFYADQLPDRGVDYDDITGMLLLGRTEREIRAELDMSVVEFIDAYLAGKLDRSDPTVEKFAIRFCIKHNGELTLVPDTAYPAAVPVFSGRPATSEEFQDLLGDLPTDGEG